MPEPAGPMRSQSPPDVLDLTGRGRLAAALGHLANTLGRRGAAGSAELCWRSAPALEAADAELERVRLESRSGTEQALMSLLEQDQPSGRARRRARPAPAC